jgi:replicative DNA helicase
MSANLKLAVDNGKGEGLPILPHNIEMEQALLGFIMSREDGLALISDVLQPDHCFEPVHARICAAAMEVGKSGAVPTPLVLKTYFERDGTLQEIGGWGYLVKLLSAACTARSARDYAQQLAELYARRESMSLCQDFIGTAADVRPDQEFCKDLAATVSDLSAIIENSSAKRKSTAPVYDTAIEVVDRAERIRAGVPDDNAISTGLRALDANSGGLHKGESSILGARPGMGKTAIACQIGMNVAQLMRGVAYFSLEMPRASLTVRMVAAKLWTPDRPIPYTNIARGLLSADELRWARSAAEEMKDWPLLINDSPGLSPAEIEAHARVMAAQLERKGCPLSLIIIDHLHKVRDRRAISKVHELTEISSAIAEMSKRLDVPILSLAQLNRSVESRDDKRPSLADLRESGAIEQDADLVMFLYREDYYVARQRTSDPNIEADRLRELDSLQGKMELAIAKQRNGPLANIDLWCDLACNVIRDEVPA